MSPAVTNMTNSNGNTVPNQFIITTPHDGSYFQSYRSVIAHIPRKGPVRLDRFYWDYSTTTSKYRNRFLNDDTKGTKAKLKSGEYVLADLNS